MSSQIKSGHKFRLPLTREVDFAKQKTEGENGKKPYKSTNLRKINLSLRVYDPAPSSEGAQKVKLISKSTNKITKLKNGLFFSFLQPVFNACFYFIIVLIAFIISA